MNKELLDLLRPWRSVDEYYQERQKFLESLSPEQREHVHTFFAIGRQNLWIRLAYDPPFSELSFVICSDVRDLAERILRGNWCLGQAFVLDDLCFINQIDGGDEWLTIKGNTPFESITMQIDYETDESAQKRFFETVDRIQKATERQCRKLDY